MVSLQSRATDEVLFLEMHHAAEAQLVRRELLRRNERLPRTGVIDIQQQQSRLNASYIQRQHARRMQIELLARASKCVPDAQRVFPVGPNLVAKIPCITGSGNVDRNSCNLAAGHAEVLQIRDV